MNAELKAIHYSLPSNVITNDDLQKEFQNWDFEKIEKKTGVNKRHITKTNETALDLSIIACEKLFQDFDKHEVEGIIYCTQSPDYIMPSNSFLLHRHFNLRQDIFVFDFNHACTGFIYSLLMANSFIKSKTASRILLINADTYSKFINPKDRSTRVLFGDGAAASIIGQTNKDNGIIDIEIGTYGIGFDKFIIPAGGARIPKSITSSIEEIDQTGNIRSQNDIKMDGYGVWSFINSHVPSQIMKLLQRNQLRIDDIDLFIFHQASLMTIESLMKILKIEKDKVFLNIREIGNTVSASIPIAYKDAKDAGILKTGQKVILSGFGVGLSYGTVLLKS